MSTTSFLTNVVRQNERELSGGGHDVSLINARQSAELRKQLQRARPAIEANVMQLRVEFTQCVNEYKRMLFTTKEEAFVSHNRDDPWSEG